ncbi:MAG: hypothetical protein ACKVS9_08850 [Phycisphaerae bacterium]
MKLISTVVAAGALASLQPQFAHSAVCTFLGLPTCCFCAWACTTTGPTLTGSVNGREVLTTADTDCCASCCPEVPANPQTAQCTVQTTAKHSVSFTGGIEIDPISVGLTAGWENETVAGTNCSANCTDCNKGHCEGGFNYTDRTYTYSERCHPFGGGGSATITIRTRNSVFCSSTTAGCGRANR